MDWVFALETRKKEAPGSASELGVSRCPHGAKSQVEVTCVNRHSPPLRIAGTQVLALRHRLWRFICRAAQCACGTQHLACALDGFQIRDGSP